MGRSMNYKANITFCTTNGQKRIATTATKYKNKTKITTSIAETIIITAGNEGRWESEGIKNGHNYIRWWIKISTVIHFGG